MKFYFEGWFHNKNKLGLDLMVREGMDVDFQCYKNGEHWDSIPTYNNTNKYDWVSSLSQFKKFPNHEGGVIFGPHIMFPNVTEKMAKEVFNKKTLFNFLSPWVCDLAMDINKYFNPIALPFAVNIEQFQPQKKDGKPVIYFKQVDRQRLNDVLEYLGEDFLIFDYEKRYQESDFAEAISKAPYAIWIGRHESQGFAFQETLSSDTPIFVIDVKSCREELNSFWSTYLPEHPLTGTAASYFDDSCGLRTYPDRWKEDWDLFSPKGYAPREFIVKNLSAKPCLEIWENKLQGLLD